MAKSQNRTVTGIEAQVEAKGHNLNASRSTIEAQEEAKGHNLNASRSTRLMTKIKTKEDRLSYYISPIMQDQHFLHRQECDGGVKLN